MTAEELMKEFFEKMLELKPNEKPEGNPPANFFIKN